MNDQRANWNVTSTVSYMAQPLDRIHTTPYGQATFDVEVVNGDWDDDGDTDSADQTASTNCWATGNVGDCRIFDYDDNGTINLFDLFDFLDLSPADTNLQRQPGRRTSPNRFPYGHQGLVLDEETLTYQNRHRQYNPSQKQFVQRDPLAFLLFDYFSADVHYGDGMRLYSVAMGNPVAMRDPSGLGCRVNYQCNLVGSPGNKCKKDCQYKCYETRRISSAGGIIDCENNNIPSIVTVSIRETGGLWCCCRSYFWDWRGCAKCSPGFPHVLNFMWESDIPPCNGVTCRKGCDITAAAARKACGRLDPVSAAACKTAAALAQTACVDVCNAFCQ